MLAAQWARAASLPMARMSYLLLFINDRFQGVYYFEETGDTVRSLRRRLSRARSWRELSPSFSSHASVSRLAAS